MGTRFGLEKPCAEQVRLGAPVHSRLGQEQPCAQQFWLGAALCRAGLARNSPVHQLWLLRRDRHCDSQTECCLSFHNGLQNT